MPAMPHIMTLDQPKNSQPIIEFIGWNCYLSIEHKHFGLVMRGITLLIINTGGSHVALYLVRPMAWGEGETSYYYEGHEWRPPY